MAPSSRTRSATLAAVGWSLGLLVIVSLVLPSLTVYPASPSQPEADKGIAKLSRDVYYQTQAPPVGPPAPRLYVTDYPARSGDSRLTIWIVAQQHVYWGGLVLGTLMLVTLLEVFGLLVRGRASASRLDEFARHTLHVILLGLSITAVLGGILVFNLLLWYPDLTTYLLGLFRPWVLLYGGLALLLTVFTYVYHYTWDSMSDLAAKYVHAALGILVNVIGCTIVLTANGWASFMTSPAGVDDGGRYLGNVWHVLHNPTWNPTNVHRLASHLLLGAAVIAAYTAYRAWTSTTKQEQSRLDERSHWTMLLWTLVLFTVQFGGYWLLRETYAYRQQIGITQLGGLFAWLNIVRVTAIGALFLGVNYYLWQRITATEAGGTVTHYAKYAFFLLAVCVAVYITPHTIVMTPLELKQMGGQQHDVVGNYGVESAKNAAVNLMIVVTAWTLCLWRLSRQAQATRAAWTPLLYLTTVFLVGAANILYLGVYGYFIPANVRIGLSVPMVVTPVGLLIFGLILTRGRDERASADHVWGGHLNARGTLALFGLAFIVTWLVGLGGYTRSGVRLFWHIYEIMRDASPWNFTPTVGFAVNVITLNALLFWATLAFILWLSSSSSTKTVPPLPERASSSFAIEADQRRA